MKSRKTVYSAVRNIPTELRQLAMADRCVLQHAAFKLRNGYKFCPWCGLELKLVGVCQECGDRFISAEAFEIHTTGHFNFYRDNPCPNNIAHGVKFNKNRERMWCPQCRFEYPLTQVKEATR